MYYLLEKLELQESVLNKKLKLIKWVYKTEQIIKNIHTNWNPFGISRYVDC